MSRWLPTSKVARERLFSELTLGQRRIFNQYGGFYFQVDDTWYFINGDILNSIKELDKPKERATIEQRVLHTYCWHPGNQDIWYISPMEWVMLLQYKRFLADPRSYKAQSVHHDLTSKYSALGSYLDLYWDPNNFSWSDEMRNTFNVNYQPVVENCNVDRV